MTPHEARSIEAIAAAAAYRDEFGYPSDLPPENAVTGTLPQGWTAPARPDFAAGVIYFANMMQRVCE